MLASLLLILVAAGVFFLCFWFYFGTDALVTVVFVAAVALVAFIALDTIVLSPLDAILLLMQPDTA